jgi:hypothetical protein
MVAVRSWRKPVSEEENQKVAFDYIKSQQFRVIHVDGAIGGVTPSGLLHFALYSERPAIPRRIVHRVDGSGRLGAGIDELMESRQSIVREMDVDVIATIEVAVSLRDWLTQKIEDHETRKLAIEIESGSEQ